MSQDRKPDWNYWSYVPNLSILQGVALSLDIDPNRIKYHLRDGTMGFKELDESHEFAERILLVIQNDAQLEVKKRFQDEPEKSQVTSYSLANLLLTINRTIPPEMEALAKAKPISAYDKWLSGKNEANIDNAQIETLRKQIETLTQERDDWKQKAEQCQKANSEGRDHYSEKLSYLIQAATKFWVNADRNDPGSQPINKDVKECLVTKGFSSSLAEKGASIIRPDWASVGRKPEK